MLDCKEHFVSQMVPWRNVTTASRVSAETGRQGRVLRCPQLLDQRNVYAISIYQSVSYIVFIYRVIILGDL